MVDDIDVHRPDDDGEEYDELFAQIQGMVAGYGPTPSPIARKITPDHIDKVLENQEKFLDVSLKDRRGMRKFWGYICTMSAAAVLALCAMLVFTGHVEVVQSLLLFLAGLFAGGLGGYGFGRRHGSGG